MNDFVDLKNNVLYGQSVAPQSVNGTVNGTAIDCRTGGAEVVVVLNVGTVASGATGTITVESSLNDNTASPDAAADAYAQIGGGSETSSTQAISGTNANTTIIMRCSLRAEKYVRVTAVTTDAIVLSATVLSPKRIVGTVQGA